MKKIILFFIVSFSIIQNDFSQSFDATKLDAYFNTLDSNNKFMGSIAIFQNGKAVYSKAVGYIDINKKIKSIENSKYRIGSITKTFTSVLVLMAAEENKLDLDNTIDKFFPTITNSNKITIRQLLYHRSGLHDYADDKTFYEWNRSKKSKKKMIQIINNGGSDFEPGIKAVYSNSNYLLLSYILSEIYNTSYSDLLQNKIIKKLNLQNTYACRETNYKNNECNSYIYLDSWTKMPECDMSIIEGTGAIVSTPSDLIQFITALFDEKLISHGSLEQMINLKDNFGMGIMSTPYNQEYKKGFAHAGNIEGFISFYNYFPEDKIAFVVTSNGLNYDMFNIAIAILNCIYNKPYEIPTFKVYEVKSEDLDQYLGVYSAQKINLKISITKTNNTLIYQPEGLPKYGLDAIEKDKFYYEVGSITLEFKLKEKQLIIKKNGINEICLIKE